MPAGEYPGVWLLQLVQQAGVGDYHHKTQAGPFHQDRARCLGRHPAGTGASPRPCGRGGVVVDRDTVRSIMREQGLVAAQPRRKVRTTVPAADLGSRPDLVKRDPRRQQAWE